jgi:pyruvate/2-oxoglutarate/acetoin dehydrogenase E1 component
MRLEMRRDPTVILFGEDVAGGATLSHLEGENKEAWGGVWVSARDWLLSLAENAFSTRPSVSQPSSALLWERLPQVYGP